MNWLKKISQVPQVPQAPQALHAPQDQISDDPIEIIEGVIEDRYDGSGPSITLPNGGGAYQKLKELTRMGTPPEVCETINAATEINVAAGPKMKILAEATGCPWNPVPPQNSDQPQQNNMMDPATMPMMGEQEKPMNMPATAEFE